jgi:hypothetical protein
MQHVTPITVAQFGIGPIGAEIAKLMLRKPWLKVVAAVDVDPAKVGKDLGEVIGLPEKTGVIVTRELPVAPAVVVHSTGSRLREVHAQLLRLLESGSHVVSTCEELSFPLDVDIRESLTVAARKSNVTLLGTGVNPGFIMDKLPLTVSAVCQEVRAVTVERIVDAASRREPLQRKVGAGMTADEFRSAVSAGTLKHVGLRESLMMIANAFNIELDRISDEIVEPLLAEEKIVTDFLTVEPGRIAGVHQRIEGAKSGVIDITLDIRVYVGAKEPGDRITVKGLPDFTMTISGGVHGDRATAAMVVNSIPRVVVARPGVLSMDDIPVSYR